MEELRTGLKALEALRSDLAGVEALRDSALKRFRDEEIRVLRLEGETSVLQRVSDLLRFLIDQEVIGNAETAQDLLTEGLQAVFDDLDLSVKASVEVQRGKVAVDLLTCQKHPDGTITEGSSLDAYGGSVSAVQSVFLRVVVVTRRGLRPLILLDESLAAVAESYVPRVGQFLAILANRLDLDVIAVSHNHALVEAATTSYRIQNRSGTAHFKRLRSGA